MEIKKERNEKIFIWHDIKMSTVYGRIKPEATSDTLHVHTHYEMFLLKSAKGYIETESGRIKLARNNMILIPPHTNHSLILDECSETKGMTIRFHYKKISDRRRQVSEQLFTLFDNAMPKKNCFLILKDKYFGQFYNDFFSESESNPTLALSLIKHMLEGLFLHILRLTYCHNKSNENVPIYSYTTMALSSEAIIANTIDDFMLTSGCTLETLSNHLKMSPRNVQRILKKTYNKTFTERLAEVRLSKAIHLIKHSNLSLNEISEKSNYNKYDSFRKAFITEYGISPSEYRENVKSGENKSGL